MKEINTIGNLIDFMLESKNKTKEYEQEIKSNVNKKYNIIDVYFIFYHISGEKPYYQLQFEIQEKNKKESTHLGYFEGIKHLEERSSIYKEFYEDNEELIDTTLNKLNNNIGSICCDSIGQFDYTTTKFNVDDSRAGIGNIIGEIDINNLTLYLGQDSEKYSFFKCRYSSKEKKLSEDIFNVLKDTPIEIIEPSTILQTAHLNDTIKEQEQTYDKIIILTRKNNYQRINSY